MRLVAVTRILNEDDIIEAFVRHNATLIDHMLFLDNGSTDATLDILRNLQAEGFALSVFQTIAASFDEVATNTWLYRLADQMHRADWIVFLDADEFIDTAGSLAERLAGRHRHDQAVTVALVHYFDTPEDDPSDPIVPTRMQWRLRAATGVVKLIVRSGLGTRITIDAGNHGATLDGRTLPAPMEHNVAYAHYPRRSGWQNLQKITIGWLKVLAAGEAAVGAGRSRHYRSPFETLRDRPQDLIGNPAYLAPGIDASIAARAPIIYRGGALRYTTTADPALKAFELGMRYAEQLARSHGALLDRSAEARHIAETGNAVKKFLF